MITYSVGPIKFVFIPIYLLFFLFKMEALYGIPFHILEVPNLKLKKPGWVKPPSAMVVFAFVLLSYFLVTGGKLSEIVSCYMPRSRKDPKSSQPAIQKKKLSKIRVDHDFRF